MGILPRNFESTVQGGKAPATTATTIKRFASVVIPHSPTPTHSRLDPGNRTDAGDVAGRLPARFRAIAGSQVAVPAWTDDRAHTLQWMSRTVHAAGCDRRLEAPMMRQSVTTMVQTGIDAGNRPDCEADAEQLQAAIAPLPVSFRETLVARRARPRLSRDRRGEAVCVGTVSRLARAASA
jgi:hypothetical protein